MMKQFCYKVSRLKTYLHDCTHTLYVVSVSRDTVHSILITEELEMVIVFYFKVVNQMLPHCKLIICKIFWVDSMSSGG